MRKGHLIRASYCSGSLRNQNHVNLTMKRLGEICGFWQRSLGRKKKFKCFITLGSVYSIVHLAVAIISMLQLICWWDSSLRLRMSCWGKDKNIGGWGNWGALWRKMKFKSITLRGAHYDTALAPAKSNFLSLSTSILAGIHADMLLSRTHTQVQVSNVL